ncbi:MAG: preprotein translocase subunit SecG [Alphaproteobacteria bacterium]|jgi:preprotein translocase subunit SecG
MILYEVLLVAYLIVAIMLVGFVLLQQGKGADMGASFGAGGSNTVFGSGGSGNFMTRTTAILATLFFTISLIIGGITAGTSTAIDEFQTIDPLVTEQAPAIEVNSSEFPVAVEETADEAVEEAPKVEDKP